MRARTTAKRQTKDATAPKLDGQGVPLDGDIQMLFLSGEALSQLKDLANGRDLSETLRAVIIEKWHTMQALNAHSVKQSK